MSPLAQKQKLTERKDGPSIRERATEEENGRTGTRRCEYSLTGVPHVVDKRWGDGPARSHPTHRGGGARTTITRKPYRGKKPDLGVTLF